MKRTLIATGNEIGITMSCHHKAYNLSGAEFWVRCFVGNIVGVKKEFAKKQLIKIPTLDSIVINGEVVK